MVIQCEVTSAVAARSLNKSAKKRASTVSEPTPSTSAADRARGDLRGLSGSSSSCESTEQQDTILLLRIEQARMTQNVAVRLDALENKALGSTVLSPRPVFTPARQSPPLVLL